MVEYCEKSTTLRWIQIHDASLEVSVLTIMISNTVCIEHKKYIFIDMNSLFYNTDKEYKICNDKDKEKLKIIHKYNTCCHPSGKFSPCVLKIRKSMSKENISSVNFC